MMKHATLHLKNDRKPKMQQTPTIRNRIPGYWWGFPHTLAPALTSGEITTLSTMLGSFSFRQSKQWRWVTRLRLPSSGTHFNTETTRVGNSPIQRSGFTDPQWSHHTLDFDFAGSSQRSCRRDRLDWSTPCCPPSQEIAARFPVFRPTVCTGLFQPWQRKAPGALTQWLP